MKNIRTITQRSAVNNLQLKATVMITYWVNEGIGKESKATVALSWNAMRATVRLRPNSFSAGH